MIRRQGQAVECRVRCGGRRHVGARRAWGLLTAVLLGATLGLAGAAGPAGDTGLVPHDAATVWPGTRSPAAPGLRVALSRAGTSSHHAGSAKATTPPLPLRLPGEVALGTADDASPAPPGRASTGTATSRAPPI